MIDQESYIKTREERINFLRSLGLDDKDFLSYIPEIYRRIPDFIWSDLIQNVLVYLEDNEDILLKSGYKHFCINGNTEGRECFLIQMYNKDRFDK